MPALHTVTCTMHERARRPVDCIDGELLRVQADAWTQRTQQAANDLHVTLSETAVPWSAEAPDNIPDADLCTFMAKNMNARVANAVLTMLLRRKAALIAVLTLAPLPDRERVTWFERWEESPLAASAVTEGGILLPAQEPLDAPRILDHVVCYQAHAGLHHAKWILERALDEHHRRLMGDLPI